MSWNPAEDPKPGDKFACDVIETVIVPRSRDLGSFEVRRALPSAQRQIVGPFIFFDQMGPSEFLLGSGMDVRPHPHIGLSTVTYLFDGENADSRFNRDAALLTRLALENGLPTVCEWGEMAKEGCLIGYDPILVDLYRRTAYYVERIFLGASPSELPIEGSARLRLVVNLKTARALGLKVPEVLILQADEIVE